MDLVEIGRMVVRLIGNTASYVSSLASASESTTSTARTVGNLNGAVNRLNNNFDTLGTTASSAMSLLGALGAKSALKEWLNIFEGKESTILKLNASIESNGGNVEELTHKYSNFAKSISDVTTTGKGQVLNMLQQAESFGLSGDAAERAVKNVIGAQAAGKQVGLFQMVALEQGNVDRLNRVLPMLRNIKDPVQKAAAAQEALNKMWGVAVAQGNTLQGQTVRVTNALKEFKGQLGEIVAEGFRPLLEYATKWIKWLQDLSPEVKRNIVIVTALIAAFLSLRVALNYTSFAMAFLTNPLTVGFIAATTALLIFIHEMGGVEGAMTKAKELFSDATTKLLELWDVSIGWAKEFYTSNQDVILSVVLVVSIITSMYLAYRLVVTVITVINAILTIFYVKQAALVVLWALWQVTMYAGIATLAIFKAFYILFGLIAVGVWTAITFVLGIGIVTTNAWSISAGIAKVFTWLWNAALAVLNFLLTGGVTLLLAMAAAIATVLVVGAGFMIVASIVMAIWASLLAVTNALLQLPATFGPVSAIGGLFKEWWNILVDVYKISQKDMPRAWEILKLAFQMAVLQVKALWPPLWDFIKEGFIIVWDMVKIISVSKFRQSLIDIYEAYIDFEARMLRVKLFALPEAAREAAVNKFTEWSKGLLNIEGMRADAIKAQADAIGNMENRLRAAVGKFGVPEDDEQIKALRSRIDELRNMTERWWKMGSKVEATNEGLNLGTAMGAGVVQGVKKELGKLDAVLFGSAEAMGRFNKYKEQLSITPEEYAARHAKGAQGGRGVPVPVGVGANRQVADNRDLLMQIRDILKERKEVELVDAGLA